MDYFSNGIRTGIVFLFRCHGYRLSRRWSVWDRTCWSTALAPWAPAWGSSPIRRITSSTPSRRRRNRKRPIRTSRAIRPIQARHPRLLWAARRPMRPEEPPPSTPYPSWGRRTDYFRRRRLPPARPRRLSSLPDSNPSTPIRACCWATRWPLSERPEARPEPLPPSDPLRRRIWWAPMPRRCVSRAACASLKTSPFRKATSVSGKVVTSPTAAASRALLNPPLSLVLSSVQSGSTRTASTLTADTGSTRRTSTACAPTAATVSAIKPDLSRWISHLYKCLSRQRHLLPPAATEPTLILFIATIFDLIIRF